MLYSSTRFVAYFLVWILLWVRYLFCLVRNFRVSMISLFLIEFYYILLIPWSLTACPSTFSLPTGHFLQIVSKLKFPPNYTAKHFTTTPPQSLPISLLPHTCTSVRAVSSLTWFPHLPRPLSSASQFFSVISITPHDWCSQRQEYLILGPQTLGIHGNNLRGPWLVEKNVSLFSLTSYWNITHL